MCGHKHLRMYAEPHAPRRVRRESVEYFWPCEHGDESDPLRDTTTRLISKRTKIAIEVVAVAQGKRASDTVQKTHPEHCET